MDIRSLTSDAIILRGKDYGEADRILIVLTKEAGKCPPSPKVSANPPAS